MTQSADIEQVLAQHIVRLRTSLQHVSGDSKGPEEGSDAWLLLNALSSGEQCDDSQTLLSFERSGSWLAEQNGKLDARLSGLQRYVDTLAVELKKILSVELQASALERLYRLQSLCTLALTRGYQEALNQRITENQNAHAENNPETIARTVIKAKIQRASQKAWTRIKICTLEA